MKNIGKFLLLSAFLSAAGVTYAQDSYDAQAWTNSDLNGTARFVSMGGALGALGGDLSVMSSNPAGTALYRRGDAALTVGGVFTGKGAMDHDGARLSMDQAGGILVFDLDDGGNGLRNVHIGLNYQKRRNFLYNQKTDIANLDGVVGQGNQVADLCNYAMENNYWGTMANMAASNSYHKGILYESTNGYTASPAYSGYYEKATYGGINQCDMNLSFNVNDKLFLGASFGVYDLDYRRESFYQERGIDNNTYDFTNWYNTSGDGYDVKFGAILRPIDDSSFRIGVSFHTPTYYHLTDANGADLYLNSKYITSDQNSDFEYKYRSPWRLQTSVGYTIGNNVALGLEYEVSDLSSAKYSEFDMNSGDYDYFRNINNITSNVLTTQHTIRAGVEYKPVDNVSLRAGYNWVSSPFKKGAYRSIGYDGVYTETDYTNWKAINRVTLGLGYKFKGGYFDLAYQLQLQKGDFYAFDSVTRDVDVQMKPTKIDANKSQVMATLGFRF